MNDRPKTKQRLVRRPIIRAVENGIVVPIPSAVTTQQPLNTGVLTHDLKPVPESITWRGGNRWTFESRIPADSEINHETGTHMFAGLLYGHFGHFLVESTARLWAIEQLKGKIDSIVFVPKLQVRLERVLENYRPFFDLLEIDIPMVNLAEPTRFETVMVPQQGFGMFGMVMGIPEYRDFMRSRIGRSVTGDGTEKLYISRSALPQKRGGLLGEEKIEEYLSDEGYRIFHPQLHSFEDQLAAYKSADFIISADGSPLHMAALAAKPTVKVAVLARRPNVAKQFDYQFRAFCGIEPEIIDAIRCHWIPEESEFPDRLSHGELNLGTVCSALKEAGFIRGTNPWQEIPEDQRKSVLSALEERQGWAFRLYEPPASA